MKVIGKKCTEHVLVDSVAQYKAIQKNSEFFIGLRFRLKPKWHIYWKNPGDSGMKTKIEWKVPKGIHLNQSSGPSPKRLYSKPLMTYGYENEVFVLASFVVSDKISIESNSARSIRVEADVKWLECREVCLPGKASIKTDLLYSPESQPLNPFFEAMLKKHQNGYPQKKHLKAWAEYDKNNLKLSIAGLDSAKIAESIIYFFIDTPGVIQHIPEQLFKFEGNTVAASLPLAINHDLKEKSVSGYLRLVSQKGGESSTYEIQADVRQGYAFYLSFIFVVFVALLWYRYKLKAAKTGE